MSVGTEQRKLASTLFTDINCHNRTGRVHRRRTQEQPVADLGEFLVERRRSR